LQHWENHAELTSIAGRLIVLSTHTVVIVRQIGYYVITKMIDFPVNVCLS
jgi:hypothetical protein